MDIKTGDTVKVVLEDLSVLEGILLPEKDNHLILKLKSGYNQGIDKAKVKQMTLVASAKEEQSAQQADQNTDLPKIAILHTGGTVASKVDYDTGGVSAKFSPDELLSLFPELRNMVQIESELIGNMMSENLRFAHYNRIASLIKEKIESGIRGVIITHGTDTLHYTAAALSFMLEHLPIPVMLVGAQRSSDRPSSDAAVNIVNAAHFITHSAYAGVAICMHENENDDSCVILPGVKTRKLHSSRRDAFKAVNAKPLAKVNFRGGESPLVPLPEKQEEFMLKPFREDIKVGIIRVHPNMSADELHYDGFDGLIIEGTGLGHMPIEVFDESTKEHTAIFNRLKSLTEKIPVVMTTQTIFGRVDMNVYAAGRKLIEAGVIGNYGDIPTDTAFIKLAWLLSNFSKEEVKSLFERNLRGEITERTENDFDTV